MTRPAELESEFARAVLDAEAEVPAPLVRKGSGAPARRFGVYRNNVYASLIDVLAGRFPATARLVGEEFFRVMARVYVEEDPPRSAVLLRYGGDFSDFIAQFPPAEAVPYLADVARLEWAWHEAYHAADAAALPPAALTEVASRAAGATLTLHPSLRVARSSYPVITIWQLAARGGENEPARLPAGGEDALVARPKMAVEVRRLPPGGAAFVLALNAGASLETAAARALEDAPDFELEANLAGLIASGVIVGIGAGA
ncbi:MAG: DNA-binding domain-containing protein [Methyloceanibacter sp.]|uniref:HvfC/BufC N-terminal domain-containing protein n=1 Tax=Methyloceanibacter sp. TaxID=1965321 RepID=UPI003D6CEE05